MKDSCPVSFIQVDGNVLRIGAFLVSTFVVAFLISSQIVLLYILAIDFYIRIYLDKKYSLIFQLAKLIKKTFAIKAAMTDGGAKRLAAQFGLLFSMLLIIQAHLELDIALYVTVSILLVCASLEFMFDYCIGCKVYYILKKINPNLFD